MTPPEEAAVDPITDPITRRIGLSLGADLCWPLCYEEIVRRLDLQLEIDGQPLRFEVERVIIEPYDLNRPTRYDVVLDRVTHWYHPSREWIKKAILLDDVYVLNNPWSLQSMEKQTTYCAMMRLGMPVPHTWMVPPKEYEHTEDLGPTLTRYAKMFDLGEVGKEIGYPMFMKPYDGGAWKGVSRIDDEGQLRAAYEQSGRMVMHLQKEVEGFDYFARCIGVGPQVHIVQYDPDAAHHERYVVGQGDLRPEDPQLLRDMTLTINAFFGWDFNSCEALRADGVWHPIDFANACPDSQVTSLHYHFPWLVSALVKWSLFCAATNRRTPMNQDWKPYLEIAESDPGMPLAERFSAYANLARKQLAADEFEAFCKAHLGALDELVLEYFASDHARKAIHAKVASLFPEHEVESFTEHFWQRVQLWRRHQEEGQDQALEV
jgi:hypothetical protein